MGRLTDTLRTWVEETLAQADLSTDDNGERATAHYQITGESGDFVYTAYFEIHEPKDIVQLFLYAPVHVPAARRAAVSELLVRLNHSYLYGYLDLDVDDGRLRFYADLTLTEGQLSTAMLTRLHEAGLYSLEQALPRLLAVAFANRSAAEAIEQADAGASLPPSPETTEAPPWERLSGVELLQTWSQELQAACAARDEALWRLTGRAVILVADNFAQARSAAHRVAQEAGLRFVPIPSDEVRLLRSLANFSRLAPVLLYLEPGRWCLPKQDDETDEVADDISAFQRRLADDLRGFNPSKPIVVVTANRALGDMSLILDGAERFDRYLVLPSPTLEQLGQVFLEDLGHHRCQPSLLANPAKLGKLITSGPNTESWHRLAVLHLQRLHHRRGQPIEFLDIMHLAMRGFAEFADPLQVADESQRRQTAVHEAGHATIAILDSGGCNIPEYCSILPGADFKGIVAESMTYHQSRGERFTYLDLRHQIRIALAGRVAEEVVYGPESVSSGAAQDLENCARQAGVAFFRYGFAPEMETPGASSSNLAVLIGDPTPSEYAHVEALVRRFLATEYPIVRHQLEQHRALLEAIADRLLWDPIVDQEELKMLCREQGIAITT